MWDQATLPVRWGGLGIRSAVKLAPCAYLASAAGAANLCLNLLPPRINAHKDQYVEPAYQAWLSMGGASEPLPLETSSQRLWDKVICSTTSQAIIATNTDPIARSRCPAAGSKGSGDWLKALPLASLGLKLSDQALSITVGLRVGADIVHGHTCTCGAQGFPNGLHGLACRAAQAETI